MALINKNWFGKLTTGKGNFNQHLLVGKGVSLRTKCKVYHFTGYVRFAFHSDIKTLLSYPEINFNLSRKHGTWKLNHLLPHKLQIVLPLIIAKAKTFQKVKIVTLLTQKQSIRIPTTKHNLDNFLSFKKSSKHFSFKSDPKTVMSYFYSAIIQKLSVNRLESQ